VLEDATVNLLTDRRRHAPPGLAGGGPGAVGRNLLEDASGTTELAPKVARRVRTGDVVTLVTPGGGGWGSP
jgi:N-methylhydantoinase B